jgi:hypothetical protein
MVKTFNNVSSADILLRIQSGLIVCNGSNTRDFGMKCGYASNTDTSTGAGDFEVSYDYFRITNTSLK